MGGSQYFKVKINRHLEQRNGRTIVVKEYTTVLSNEPVKVFCCISPYCHSFHVDCAVLKYGGVCHYHEKERSSDHKTHISDGLKKAYLEGRR